MNTNNILDANDWQGFNAHIATQIAERGEFNFEVKRWTWRGEETLRFTAMPHPNPICKWVVYSVTALAAPNGNRNFDANVNKDFSDSRLFMDSIQRYRRLEKKHNTHKI